MKKLILAIAARFGFGPMTTDKAISDIAKTIARLEEIAEREMAASQAAFDAEAAAKKKQERAEAAAARAYRIASRLDELVWA